MSINSKTKSKIKKGIAISLIVLVIGTIGFASYQVFLKPKPAPKPANEPVPQTTQPSGAISEQLKQEAEANADAKRQMAEGPAATPKSSGDSKRAVSPVITSVSPDELRGFVSGIAEDGGTCTATFTKESAIFTKTSAGFINVANTNCNLITLSSSDFTSKGNWSVTLTYSSSMAAGTSSTTNLEVH